MKNVIFVYQKIFLQISCPVYDPMILSFLHFRKARACETREKNLKLHNLIAIVDVINKNRKTVNLIYRLALSNV